MFFNSFWKNFSSPKNEEYEKRVISILANGPLTITSLANQMDYKGITSKLSKTVKNMVNHGILERIVDGNVIKLTLKVDRVSS